MNRPSVLEGVARDVLKRLNERRSENPIERLKSRVETARPPHDFAQAAARTAVPRVIAEVKLKSPSHGPIAADLDPVAVAGDYLKNGAAALSILTEQDHFGGSLKILESVRAAHPDAVLLLKDFVLDEYQLFEARACGADTALLIIALLGEDRAAELLIVARGLGLEPLVEVHDEEEMRAAIRIGARVIGVNNRDLRTLKIDLDTCRRLRPLAPPDIVLVAESGLKTATEVRELFALGFSAFLIGTSFMKTGHPGQALAQLRKDL